MSALIKLNQSKAFSISGNLSVFRPRSTAASTKDGDQEEFRVLQLWKKKEKQTRKIVKRPDPAPDRAERMAPDQNWGNVWPGPRSFHPATVPLPLRQGWVQPGQAPPSKKANAELMKIPNFLHLTPPVIQRQCEALKQFCTPWPKGLNSEEAIERNYPLEVLASDYCHASPTIRNPLARIVSLRFKLAHLNLDEHARDKFLRLIGNRYDEATDLVTITADRCPLRKQNLDYVNYLLTALYHESHSYEDWEKEKSEQDMEKYVWDNNRSKRTLVEWHLRSKGDFDSCLSDNDVDKFDVSVIEGGVEFKDAVSGLINGGESEKSVAEYGDAVRRLFGLPSSDN